MSSVNINVNALRFFIMKSGIKRSSLNELTKGQVSSVYLNECLSRTGRMNLSKLKVLCDIIQCQLSEVTSENEMSSMLIFVTNSVRVKLFKKRYKQVSTLYRDKVMTEFDSTEYKYYVKMLTIIFSNLTSTLSDDMIDLVNVFRNMDSILHNNIMSDIPEEHLQFIKILQDVYKLKSKNIEKYFQYKVKVDYYLFKILYYHFIVVFHELLKAVIQSDINYTHFENKLFEKILIVLPLENLKLESNKKINLAPSIEDFLEMHSDIYDKDLEVLLLAISPLLLCSQSILKHYESDYIASEALDYAELDSQIFKLVKQAKVIFDSYNTELKEVHDSKIFTKHLQVNTLLFIDKENKKISAN